MSDRHDVERARLSRRPIITLVRLARLAASCTAVAVLTTLNGLGRPLRAQQPGVRQHVQTLATEKLDGRLTGSPGERMAADYIVSQLQRIGAKTLPGLADYRVAFEFTAGSRDGGSTIGLKWKKSGTEGGLIGGVAGGANQSAGSRALSFSDNGDVDAPVVFAGYGIVVPE